MIPVSDLLESVARAVGAAGIRAVAYRAPLSWRDHSDVGPYVVVTHVSPWAPSVRGDDRTLWAVTSVQASLWVPAGFDAGPLLTALEGALDGVRLDVGVVGRNLEMLEVPEPDSTDRHYAATVSYVGPAVPATL
jgi:hypothetical protein